MNASANSLDLHSTHVVIIVPVGALLHQLDGGVMTYLDNNGVTTTELLEACVELCFLSKTQIARADANALLQRRFTDIVEELEYNHRLVDYETLETIYVGAVYNAYVKTYPYISHILDKTSLSNVHDPLTCEIRTKASIIPGKEPLDDSVQLHLYVTEYPSS